MPTVMRPEQSWNVETERSQSKVLITFLGIWSILVCSIHIVSAKNFDLNQGKALERLEVIKVAAGGKVEPQPTVTNPQPVINELTEEQLFGGTGKQFLDGVLTALGRPAPKKYYFVLAKTENLSIASAVVEKLQGLSGIIKENVYVFQPKGSKTLFITIGVERTYSGSMQSLRSVKQRIIDSLPTLAEKASREAAVVVLKGVVVNARTLFR